VSEDDSIGLPVLEPVMGRGGGEGTEVAKK